jgi:hypothetical protein
MVVSFERHPGTYNDEMDFFMFYGLMFESIFDVAKFFKKMKYDPEMILTGHYYREMKYLMDEVTGMVWIGNGWLPDETFLKDYCNKRHGKDSIKVHNGHEFD